jgi:hypothetical protein
MSTRQGIAALVVLTGLGVCAPQALAQEGNPVMTDDELERVEDDNQRACDRSGGDEAPDGTECDPNDTYDGPEDGEAPGGGGSDGGSQKKKAKPKDRSVPKVSRLRVQQVSGGRKISFRVSERAHVTLVFDRCTVFKGGGCIHWSRTGMRVMQWARKGGNSVLVGHGSLRSGRHRVEAHAVDKGHHHSNMPKAVFVVQRG